MDGNLCILSFTTLYKFFLLQRFELLLMKLYTHELVYSIEKTTSPIKSIWELLCTFSVRYSYPVQHVHKDVVHCG